MDINKEYLEEMFYRILQEEAKASNPRSIESFTLRDEAAWRWGVRLYAIALKFYADSFNGKDDLWNAIQKTKQARLKQEQAKQALALMEIEDEKEEGFWLKQFMERLRVSSSYGGQEEKRQRSFHQNERANFLKSVSEHIQNVKLTALVLALALLDIMLSRIMLGSVEDILQRIPKEAEQYYLPMYASYYGPPPERAPA